MLSLYKAAAATEPVCDSAALRGDLTLLLEWETWPGNAGACPAGGGEEHLLALYVVAYEVKLPGNGRAELPSVANSSFSLFG